MEDYLLWLIFIEYFCRFHQYILFGVNDSIDSIDELSESDKSGDDDDEFLLVVVWECLGVNSELGVLLIENVIVGLLNFTPPPPPIQNLMLNYYYYRHLFQLINQLKSLGWLNI